MQKHASFQSLNNIQCQPLAIFLNHNGVPSATCTIIKERCIYS